MTIYKCQSAEATEDTWAWCGVDGTFIIIETVEDCSAHRILLTPADAIVFANSILRQARRLS